MKKPRFDIRSIVKRSGRRKPVRLRPIPSSSTIEREAERLAREVVEQWRAVALNLLAAYEAALRVKARDGLTLDAAGDNLSTLLARESEEMRRFLLGLEPGVRLWGDRVERWQRTRFGNSVSGSLNLDIFPYLSGADVEDEVAAAVERFASLIRGLSGDLEKRVGETVWREYLKQTPRKELGRMLSDELSIGRSRANLIAKDQTIKLSAELNQQRQQQVGIESYIWRTADDDRVRPTHEAREGKVFRWDDDGIKPGEEINCRCTAQAYLEPTAGE